MSKLKKLVTGDGSPTIYNAELDEPYHSRHGALAESMHVFIKNGLEEAVTKFETIQLFEMGIGTGLNLLLTLNHWNKAHYNLNYTGLELHPLSLELLKEMQLGKLADNEHVTTVFEQFIETPFGNDFSYSNNLSWHKIQADLLSFKLPKEAFNLVFFDAFGPPTQPGLWTKEVFQNLYQSMVKGGILVTYCAKGQVRRNMLDAGFRVGKLPGPPKKREMLRAIKT